ncbi:MAG: precorrin-2 C(20)-methyltransferase [Candidatus Roseilinea sp.]|uniref:precorrin-2 C(20)-methyltransferase n=1 Tax=Candidatus Roseilinea sp. TaxID=2838777 RepID=UPI00404976B3
MNHPLPITANPGAAQPGSLWGVGVGPGDPDLLTLKAARVIQQADVIAAPTSQKPGPGYALRSIAGLLRPDHIIEELLFPMTRDMAERERHRAQAARIVEAHLAQGRQVAFVTEGDPLIHSTFIYLMRHLPTNATVRIVPGVTSITAAAAEAALPLVNGNQRLAVLPATVEDARQLPALMKQFDTLVLLKVSQALDDWLDALARLSPPCEAVLIERASTSQARVVRDAQSLRGQCTHYLSLLIVQRKQDQSSSLRSE